MKLFALLSVSDKVSVQLQSFWAFIQGSIHFSNNLIFARWKNWFSSGFTPLDSDTISSAPLNPFSANYDSNWLIDLKLSQFAFYLKYHHLSSEFVFDG